MSKSKKVSDTLTIAENSVINETLTSKNENMENVENANETLVETQENANATEVLTPEMLTEKIKVAKIALAELNAKFDYDETNGEIIAKESEISNLLDERKKLVKTLEREKLLTEFNEKLENAKNDLIAKFGITPETLTQLLENSKIENDTLITSFNIVFGKKSLHIAENVTGKSLTKSIAKTGGDNANGFNITKNVKQMLTDGNSSETIVNVLLANTDMDETKAKKRLNDVKWAWEIENGLRVKK
jgi:hypothetical protein